MSASALADSKLLSYGQALHTHNSSTGCLMLTCRCIASPLVMRHVPDVITALRSVPIRQCLLQPALSLEQQVGCMIGALEVCKFTKHEFRHLQVTETN